VPGALAWQDPALRLIKELGHIELVVWPGRDTNQLNHGQVQLQPARVAPVIAQELIGLIGRGHVHNLTAQLVGAAHHRVGGLAAGSPSVGRQG